MYSSLTLGTLNKIKLMLCALFSYVMGDKIKRLSMSVVFFTPKFGKKNVGTRSFQDCVIKESIICESVSVDLDAMSKSTIL